MTVEQSFKRKLYSLIYPKSTPTLSADNSTYLGTTSPQQLPENIDDFYKIWFADFNNWTKWFGPFRMTAESFFKNDRFVSFAEYLEIFKDREVKADLQHRYPVYKLLGISKNSQKQRFVNSYTDDSSGYFKLMKAKNPRLWALFKTSYPVRYYDEDKKKHAYAVGRTGSGKTELMKFCLLEDIRKGDSCVIVIEPNGDFSEQVAKQKELPPERLVYVTFDVTDRTVRINPLELIKGTSDDEIQIQTQNVRRALEKIFFDTNDKFSDPQQAILEPCLDVIVRQKGTLKDLLRFMADDANSDLVEAGKKIPKHQSFFETMFYQPTFKVSKLSLYKRIKNLLDLGSVEDFLCGETSINLRKAIKDKKVIVFNLSKGKLGDTASKYIGKLMFAMIENLIFQRASIPEHEREPLRIYIDEVQDFATTSIEDLFVQCRKYNAGLFIASQIVGQKMSAEITKVVLSSTHVKFAGINGYDTLRTMSRENYADINDLRKLSVGQFFCRMGEAQGVSGRCAKT